MALMAEPALFPRLLFLMEDRARTEGREVEPAPWRPERLPFVVKTPPFSQQLAQMEKSGFFNDEGSDAG